MRDSRTERTIRIGTRGSPLALWQSGWVADRLHALWPGLGVELVRIATQGDRDRNSPLASIGGQGLFTKEIQRAVLDGQADLAVHSLKDLPARGPVGLVLAAVPPREEPFDGLIAPRFRTLDALPAGARVGTGSGRRRAQILHARPDVVVVGLRGNVETRLEAALGGELDAVVLAMAGLRRLGREPVVTERLGPPCFLPAVGQGALGLECRADDEATRALVAGLDDPDAHASVQAERQLMADLEAGCSIPLAAWGRVEAGALHLSAAVYDREGRRRIGAEAVGDVGDPAALGHEVARSLLEQGAGDLLRAGDRPD